MDESQQMGASKIFIGFVLQVVFTVGLIVLFGFLIALCNKRFYANFGNYGRAVCYLTGAIGTPIAEPTIERDENLQELAMFDANNNTTYAARFWA